MRAADVMTREVLTVDADKGVREAAALLSERGISGVPVVDEDKHVIGIVSEGDLLHRTEIGTSVLENGGARGGWTRSPRMPLLIMLSPAVAMLPM